MNPVSTSLRARLAAALLLCAAGSNAVVAAPTAATHPDDVRDAASLHALAAAERARPIAPRLPRSDFLAQPMLRGARLSPDGRGVAALVDDGRQRSLWLATIAQPEGRRLLERTSADDLDFSRDGRWLFLRSGGRVDALAMTARGGSTVIAELGGRGHLAFFGVDPSRPAAVLLLESPPPASPPPKRWRLWRATPGRARVLLHESRLPIVDAAFAPGGALSHLLLASGESHVVVRHDAGDAWRALATCTGTRRCAFIGTTHAGADLLMRATLDGDLAALVQLGADGARRTLHVDPRGEADLDEVVLDPVDGTPLVASYRSTVAANYALAADVQPALAIVAARYRQGAPRIELGRGDDARWLLHERSGTLRGERLQLFDPRSGRSDEVFGQLGFQRGGKPAARLPQAAMARQVALSWVASDGLRLHGFLWLPPGRDAARVPLVVNVHGGPFNQVGPDFSNGAQFLANRGYAVFAPNFRASTGVGRRVVLSSRGDFGGEGRVQRDIVEGTRWLLAHGIGDANRVGIVGASYGGYATLLGLTFQPDLFKVGVAAVPPTDFAFVIREYLGSGVELAPGVPMAATMRHLGVDPADVALMARLHAGSPVANVARMRGPLLMLAGGEDERVPIRGVTDYAARLKALGRDVSLFVDADAGHNIGDPRTREAYYYLEEAMLQRHLGGAAPEPPDAALRAHIKRNLRLVGASLDPE